jgi:hypothetical protein
MRAARARELLTAYFSVPGRKGFSAYRTGWFVHLIFSVLVAEVACVVLGRMGMSSLPLRAAGALLAVLVAWGAGTFLGILSHHSPLVVLLAIGGLVASFRLLGDVAPVGLVLGFAAHWAALLLLSGLQRLRGSAE